MVPPHLEVMSSSSSTSAIPQIECFVTPSLTALPWSIMVPAPGTRVSSSTSPPTSNSQENSVTQIAHFSSAVSGTGNVSLGAAMATWSVRLVWAALTAIPTFTVMCSSLGLANTLCNPVSCATPLTCVTWVEDAGLTPVRPPVESALSISPSQQVLVSYKTSEWLHLAIYANSPQDLLMC